MSTILDALKKVEQERDTDSAASKKRQLDALSPNLDNERQSRTRKYVKWGTLLLVVGFLGGVTISLFSDDPEPAASKAARATTPQSGKKVKKTVVAQDRPTQPPKHARPSGPRPDVRQQPALTQQPPNRPQPSLSRPIQPPVEPSPGTARDNRTTALNQTQPRPNRPPAATNQQPAARRPRPDREAQVPASPPVSPTPKTTVPPKPQPKQPPKPAPSQREITRLTDGSLKVQAIAWSPIAEERMAVMNGKILREGSSVDDYTLVTIRQDDVVVRKGGGGEYRVVIGRN